MTNAFVRKLEYGAALTDEDRRLLATVSATSRHVAARAPIIEEGEEPSDVHLVLEGVACRYKILPDGNRQIMAFFLPGDICDMHVQILGAMDHSIGTLTECRMVELPPEVIVELTANPRINRALWWASLTDEATLREWLVNIGQRSGIRRVAHLFAELLTRYQAVGLAADDSFPVFFTQEELGSATGLTTVHVNRMLRDLREQGLVVIEGRRCSFPDVAGLKRFSAFTPNYLHFRNPRHKAEAKERLI